MNVINKSKGYTLIEIVVVISIMAILSAVIYSSFDASRAKSRDQKRISDISAIQISLEQYFQKNGIYPLTLNSLIPTYMSSIPRDPSTNMDFNVSYFPISKGSSSNNCVSYQLWTIFEQGNMYLGSKRAFDSTLSVLPNNMFECGSLHSRVDATAGAMVYDVMP
mgnify:CR=1 FL=1